MTSRRSARPFALCEKSYGAVSRDKAVEEIEGYCRRTKECLGIEESHRLLKLGHQAGAYERYPKDLKEICEDTADISSLMEESFVDYDLDGIEIDIQIDLNNVVGEGSRHVYVVHNKLEDALDPYAIDYLKRNTLKQVLKGFIDSRYHEKDKHIYIEIKCDDSKRIDHRDEATISGALDVIAEVANRYSSGEADKIREHIGFASFNYRALERVAELGGGQHGLFFIAASNRALGWIAVKTIYPHLNYLGKKLKKVLSRSEFLSGVWFDPCAMNDFGRVLNRINAKREENATLKPLKVFVSTYLLGQSEYFDRLRNDKEKLKNVEGLFFDIKSSKTSSENGVP